MELYETSYMLYLLDSEKAEGRFIVGNRLPQINEEVGLEGKVYEVTVVRTNIAPTGTMPNAEAGFQVYAKPKTASPRDK